MKKRIAYAGLILVMIAVITVLHYVTKSTDLSLHQAYMLLFFIPIIIASIQFGFKGGTITSLIISIIYSPQKLLSIGPQGDALHELFDVFLFVAIGIVTGILVERKNLALKTMNTQINKYVILENYTNSVFDSINLGIIAINNDYFITSINSGAKKLIGVSDECIGQNFVEVFSCCKDIEAIIMKAIRDNRPLINLERNIQKDNNEFYIKMDTFPLSLDNKNKGLVIIVEDITEIRKIKNQMHRNDKLASVGQLATGIAHEIRNPLAIIKMTEQTMSKELADNKELQAELNIIDEEVERANKVIKSLMEFSKPNKNEKGLNSIDRIIEDVLTLTNKYLSQHKVNVSYEKGEVPDGVYDREQLIQAFVNLVFNAVDAMPEGGTIHISTRFFPDEYKTRILFEDTGQGIEEADIGKIFDPFFTTKAEGTGLGLPILYRIIEDHEGTISVKSKPGKGTTFEIFI